MNPYADALERNYLEELVEAFPGVAWDREELIINVNFTQRIADILGIEVTGKIAKRLNHWDLDRCHVLRMNKESANICYPEGVDTYASKKMSWQYILEHPDDDWDWDYLTTRGATKEIIMSLPDKPWNWKKLAMYIGCRDCDCVSCRYGDESDKCWRVWHNQPDLPATFLAEKMGIDSTDFVYFKRSTLKEIVKVLEMHPENLPDLDFLRDYRRPSIDNCITVEMAAALAKLYGDEIWDRLSTCEFSSEKDLDEMLKTERDARNQHLCLLRRRLRPVFGDSVSGILEYVPL